MIFLMNLVLYCEKEFGSGRELQDFSNEEVIAAPVWAQDGVLYQVYPRMYTKEGTFKGIADRLDYMKQLGVNIIWLKPIFPIGQKGRKGVLGSSYSVKDFRKINPEYGTEDDFQKLVKTVHERNMKIIIGIVPNHASNDNSLIQDHPNWFIQDSSKIKDPEVLTWTDVTVFNYDDPEMRQYMMDTLIYWVEKFDVDGYRCDVAGMVPLDFWGASLKKLREAKSDIFLLAEWEDPELQIQGFNADYDWTLYHLLKDIRNGKNKTADAINLIQEKDSHYPQNSLPMRFLENHDEQRSLSVFKKDGIEAFATFLFTVPGIPLIYAGQEIGETVKPSLFEKGELGWSKVDDSLRRMYQNLMHLRKNYSCFTNGVFQPLVAQTNNGSAGAFIRKDDKSMALVICNLDSMGADNVSIKCPYDLNELQGFKLVNYKNPSDNVSLTHVRFNRLDPLTTLVYVHKK